MKKAVISLVVATAIAVAAQWVNTYPGDWSYFVAFMLLIIGALVLFVGFTSKIHSTIQGKLLLYVQIIFPMVSYIVANNVLLTGGKLIDAWFLLFITLLFLFNVYVSRYRIERQIEDFKTLDLTKQTLQIVSGFLIIIAAFVVVLNRPNDMAFVVSGYLAVGAALILIIWGLTQFNVALSTKERLVMYPTFLVFGAVCFMLVYYISTRMTFG